MIYNDFSQKVTKIVIYFFSQKLPIFVNFNVDPQAPVAQKIADEVVFRHFQGEGVEFF